jgi:hypothetical protein
VPFVGHDPQQRGRVPCAAGPKGCGRAVTEADTTYRRDDPDGGSPSGGGE